MYIGVQRKAAEMMFSNMLEQARGLLQDLPLFSLSIGMSFKGWVATLALGLQSGWMPFAEVNSRSPNGKA